MKYLKNVLTIVLSIFLVIFLAFGLLLGKVILQPEYETYWDQNHQEFVRGKCIKNCGNDPIKMQKKIDEFNRKWHDANKCYKANIEHPYRCNAPRDED